MRLYEILDKIISKLGIDWVVERSNINGWAVKKWHSGEMGQVLYRRADNAGWNDIPYITGLVVSTKSYPFPQSFIGAPGVVASVTGGTGIGIGVTTHPSKEKVTLHVTGSQSCTQAGANDITIIAYGRWK
ncbi:MAG: hypothetical protein PUK14_02760 [Clostridiales bacterium]|nr:hypothetical protein [Clostridiales bacterium]MDY6116381.1 hypothetical protein [Anaerovoracaceae bacterium]